MYIEKATISCGGLTVKVVLDGLHCLSAECNRTYTEDYLYLRIISQL